MIGVNNSSAAVFMDEKERKSTFRSYESFQDLISLTLSASEQFSLEKIQNTVNATPHKNCWIVDLREESHFFLNGLPVSVSNFENNANQGKTLEEIQADEQLLVSAIQNAESIELYVREKIKKIQEDGSKIKEVVFSKKTAISLEEVDVCTEEMLVSNVLKALYLRIPVTDHGFPSNLTIDRLITLYDAQKMKSPRIHFHCAAGKGRSSTALAIFAILHESKSKSLSEIFSSLECIGNVRLVKEGDLKDGKPVKQRSDIVFWSEFYDFAMSKERADGMMWSVWKNKTS